jgi:hypothetical protein
MCDLDGLGITEPIVGSISVIGYLALIGQAFPRILGTFSLGKAGKCLQKWKPIMRASVLTFSICLSDIFESWT